MLLAHTTLFLVTQVTKALERKELSVVFVCRSVQPPLLTAHIRQLAALQGVCVCALPDFGPLLSQVFKVPKVAAAGLKKSADANSGQSSVRDLASGLVKLLGGPLSVSGHQPVSSKRRGEEQLQPTKIKRVPVAPKPQKEAQVSK